MQRFRELLLYWKDLRRTFDTFAIYVLKPVTRAQRECIISCSLVFKHYHQFFFHVDILVRIFHQCFRYLKHFNIVVHAPFQVLMGGVHYVQYKVHCEINLAAQQMTRLCVFTNALSNDDKINQ